MKIVWHGGSKVEMATKKSKVILNPDKKDNLKDVQIIAYDKTDDKHQQEEGSLMVDWPGEYDKANISFKGIECLVKKNPHLIYNFTFKSGNVAWMGDLAEYPSEKVIEKLGEVHVLLVPVGGGDVLDAKNAFKLVEALEPMVVIPICYGDKRDGLSPFLKEMDVKHPEAQKSFDFKRSSLNSEQMELVILGG